ncbi:acyl-CoA dehydrogenase family protein [Pseudoduganella ginsengisoli]|uniref:Isovaleryl-CoA dehydrogenase n=1 Tax=Pseudoduganella ginsengisoli TaxID=1462440 RepID=A0A6L6Q0S5_9BURK|nr:isovaleryl-CoA dehydrogenase [Pseudoduganella ginsengisoli]MTW03245.1 isovaleryl-CoA dehydrogenase [Pseudoduganella ginsengisoli]
MPVTENPFETHQVLNQPAPFGNVNLYLADIALREALEREGGAAAHTELVALGERLGLAETLDLARLANANKPVLHHFDRTGKRIDQVEFHPAWHQLMQMLIEHGAHASAWDGAPGAQVARAAKYLLFGQVENGAQCPVTMTYASVAALRHAAPALAQQWLPKILSRDYDPRPLPIAQKRGALIGMGMTEKQGGSDVRANTTRAEPVLPSEAQSVFGAEAGGVYRIVGHKWFYSAPQCDAHLVLAQTEEGTSAGLSCFLVPGYLPDGSRNQVRVQRLKDKLGNCSNASSEVEFTGAYGWLVGQAGRGIPTILDMASLTRLDCVIGSAATMRSALTHVLHHARRRTAFGKPLSEQPLMQNVLADLALESEAATVLAMRLARCFDHPGNPQETLLGRILTPAGKYWVCKRGPAFGAEAMEVIGGSGYVEESPLARMYRDFPVNSIWEGSGNIMCLDLLRAFGKSPAAGDALAAELALAGGGNAHFDGYRAALLADVRAMAGQAPDEFGARVLAERIVLAVQAALLLRHAPRAVSEAFIASRIDREPGGAFGRLPAGTDCAAILARALPQ